MTYQPLVIIGAPRSGTNMLRDVFTRLDGVATWPCDEINYIWRYKNAGELTDELSPDLASRRVRRYIRKQFDWVSREYRAHIVVEKTCANSLRVPFVNRVLPSAKYVFIYRDGLDVVGSALKRWKADLDISYLLRKSRFVPVLDMPFYAYRFLLNRTYRFLSPDDRLAFWGPHFSGMGEALGQYSLPEVCALQWKQCVDLSEAAFSNMRKGKVARVSYEAFVENPAIEILRISNELGLQIDTRSVSLAIRGVEAASVGKGRNALDEKTFAMVSLLVGDTLRRYGYE